MKKIIRCMLCVIMLLSLIPARKAQAAAPIEITETDFYVKAPVASKTAEKASGSVTALTEGVAFLDGSNTAWIVKDGGDWTILDPTSSFEEGKEYGIRIQLTAKEGYAIASAATAKVNGQTATIEMMYDYILEEDAPTVVYSFGTLNKDKQYSINVTDGYAQVGGVKVTQAKAGAKVQLIATSTDPTEALWYWDGLGISDQAPGVSKFEFTMPAQDVNVKAVFGKVLTEANCTTLPMNAGDGIDSVPVSDEPAKYTVEYSKIYGILDSNDKLIAGNTYEYDVKFTAKPGYVFEPVATQYTINGEGTTLVGIGSGSKFSYVTRRLTFVAHDDTDEKIDKLTFKGVAPVDGATPSISTVEAAADSYQITKAEWCKVIFGTDGSTSFQAESVWGTFASGDQYALILNVAPEDGYYFDPDTKDISDNANGILMKSSLDSTQNEMVVYLCYNLGKTYTLTGTGTWKKGSTTGYQFTVNGSEGDFVSAEINGNKSSYLTRTGTDELTFTLGTTFLNNARVGEHSVCVYFKDGMASGTLEVCKADHIHIYSEENTADKYLKSAVDCENAAVYYKSCSCGEASTTDTFVSGSALGHTLVHTDAVKATCSATGNIEYWQCSVCEKYYSNATATTEITKAQTVTDKDPSNHTGDTEIKDDKKPTCTEKGYTGDTYCKSCGVKISSGSDIDALTHKYGAWTSVSATQHQRVCANDATHVEKEDHTFVGNKCSVCGYEAEPISYTILDGADSEWTKGSTDGLMIRSDAAFAKFVSVMIDDAVVASSNYIAEEGSTKITLLPTYLESLSTGIHKIDIVSNDGKGSTKFTIKSKTAPNPVPPTGDNNPVRLWLLLMAVMAGMTGMLLYFKKRTNA